VKNILNFEFSDNKNKINLIDQNLKWESLRQMIINIPENNRIILPKYWNKIIEYSSEIQHEWNKSFNK